MSDERIEGYDDTPEPERVQAGPGAHPDHRQADSEFSAAGGLAPHDSGPDVGEPAGLFDQREVSEFSDRWEDIQVRFVDQPRESVAAADQLVDDVVNTVTTRMGDQRRQLESLWQRDEEVSTEQLRQSLQRYHALFDRLLSTPTAPTS